MKLPHNLSQKLWYINEVASDKKTNNNQKGSYFY